MDSHSNGHSARRLYRYIGIEMLRRLMLIGPSSVSQYQYRLRNISIYGLHPCKSSVGYFLKRAVSTEQQHKA